MASPNLPSDIIENILSRLPAKSLKSFICVSKTWQMLITSNAFIHLHLSRSKDDHLVLGRRFYSGCYFLDDVHMDLDANGDCPLPIKVCDGIVWGSCHGLLCISCRTSQVQPPGYALFLWNPSTGEYKQLPPPNLTDPDPAFSLGYNNSLKDYEILGMCSDSTVLGSVVDVYTFKENSWRTISNHIPYSVGSYTSRVLLHSKHHWDAFHSALRKISILSFDIEDKTFQEIPMPHFEYDPPNDYTWMEEHGFFQMDNAPDQEDRGPDIVLTTLSNCLCVCRDRPHTKQIEVWIMKVYGVAESWTKVYGIDIPRYITSLTPLFCNIDGAVLMLNDDSGLALYDPKNGSLRILTKYHRLENCSFQAKTYRQSIVTLGVGSHTVEAPGSWLCLKETEKKKRSGSTYSAELSYGHGSTKKKKH